MPAAGPQVPEHCHGTNADGLAETQGQGCARCPVVTQKPHAHPQHLPTRRAVGLHEAAFAHAPLGEAECGSAWWQVPGPRVRPAARTVPPLPRGDPCFLLLLSTTPETPASSEGGVDGQRAWRQSLGPTPQGRSDRPRRCPPAPRYGLPGLKSDKRPAGLCTSLRGGPQPGGPAV